MKGRVQSYRREQKDQLDQRFLNEIYNSELIWKKYRYLGLFQLNVLKVLPIISSYSSYTSYTIYFLYLLIPLLILLMLIPRALKKHFLYEIIIVGIWFCLVSLLGKISLTVFLTPKIQVWEPLAKSSTAPTGIW